MKDNELSIFIDEAGDYGTFDISVKDFSDRFYIVTLVFHEQNHSIEKQLNFLKNRLEQKEFNFPMIHCGPLIRKEPPFKGYKSEEIKSILFDLVCFIKNIDINYYPIIIDKTLCKDRDGIEKALTTEINELINYRYHYFSNFSKINIYYDNGQRLVSNVINKTFECELSNTDRRVISPKDYRLFQVADLICTFILLELKRQRFHFSSSESRIFTNKEFKKVFLGPILKKKIK